MTIEDFGIIVGAMFRLSHAAMATEFEVIIAGEEEAYAGDTAQELIAELDRIERLLSRFDPGSEVSRINRLEPGEYVAVEEDVFAALKTAERIRRETNGAFDINLASGAAFKLMRSRGKYEVRRGKGLRNHRGPGAGARLGEVEDGRLRLDLGGIGKGFALDKCREILSRRGVKRALVHGGKSTVTAVGAPQEHEPGWLVEMAQNWDGPEVFRRAMLRGRALSGSGTDKKGPHILNPLTGAPARGHLAAWASHPSAAVSDALSTAFMVMDTEEVAAFCDEDIQVFALVITGEGDCRVFNPEVLFGSGLWRGRG